MQHAAVLEMGVLENIPVEGSISAKDLANVLERKKY